MRMSADDFPDVPMQEMQQAHLEEIEIINAIDDLIIRVEAGGGGEVFLTEKLEELQKHTHAHFAYEEELMQKAAFPPFAMHKSAHDQFLEVLDKMMENWHNSHEIGPLDQFMRFELPRWMKQHINTMDYVTAGFLSGVMK